MQIPRTIPKTLLEAVRYYSDEQVCIDTLAETRWPNGIECPSCLKKNVLWLANQKRWKCRDCKRQFSVKVKTIFEDSPIPLQKWLPALWMLTNCKNGISSWELHRSLGVTQKTAWFMLHRLRLVHRGFDLGTKLGGPGKEVECDETAIGGKLGNMHAKKKAAFRGSGAAARNKTIVMGALDRAEGQVKATIIPFAGRETMDAIVRKGVKFGSTVYTDQHVGYNGLRARYTHETVNHMETYVRGRVHTNGIENFWSLLKRQIGGTYIAVEPFHLHRYVDEQVFRFNNRATRKTPRTDADRFMTALAQVSRKRITYAELTGKTGEPRH
jgi:transposase-like protein